MFSSLFVDNFIAARHYCVKDKKHKHTYEHTHYIHTNVHTNIPIYISLHFNPYVFYFTHKSSKVHNKENNDWCVIYFRQNSTSTLQHEVVVYIFDTQVEYCLSMLLYIVNKRCNF